MFYPLPTSGTWHLLPALALRLTHAAGRDAAVPRGSYCSLSLPAPRPQELQKVLPSALQLLTL